MLLENRVAILAKLAMFLVASTPLYLPEPGVNITCVLAFRLVCATYLGTHGFDPEGLRLCSVQFSSDSFAHSIGGDCAGIPCNHQPFPLLGLFKYILFRSSPRTWAWRREHHAPTLVGPRRHGHSCRGPRFRLSSFNPPLVRDPR